jgi:hypothetical protein
MAQTLNFEQQLSDLLDTRDFHPETLGRDGRPCDTEDAKTFSFDYVSGSGKNYGTMVIVLGNDNEMMIMYGDNLGKTIEDPEDRNEFFDFQQQLMQLANRNRWTGTLTNLNKLKRVQAGIAAIQEGLFEGYYGTRKVSYAGEPTEARLMIRHNRVLGENDARFRYVESLFIETADQERFKLPFVNMAGGRAMLEHVRQGGKPYDVRGSHITETVNELKVLSRFRRASHDAVAEGVKQSVIEQANTYYQQLREGLKHLGTRRGYTAYFESWSPMQVADHESLVEDIKSLFVEQTLDARIEEALPLLARIQQQGQDMKEAQIFENWINNLAEGTWALPETPEQQNRLKELMSQPLEAGPDGTNATEQLYDLVGDDQLFDLIGDQAEQDPNANIWENPAIMDRLSELGVDVPQNNTADAEAEPADVEQDTAPAVKEQGVTEAIPATEIDPKATQQYAQQIIQALQKATGATVKDFSNQDGTIKIVINPDPSDRTYPPSRGYIVTTGNDGATMQNVSKAINPYYNIFRQKGWRFDQPVGGAFTIGVPTQQAVAENAELDTMLKYAGVPVKESVLTDSTGSTLDHICDRFGKEVRDFEATGDMSDDLFHALYDYYFDDMPYGTKKARDGDPYEWVADRFAQDRGIAENLVSPMAMPVTTEGSSCNMTMEGDYCPEHGLAECGSMYEMGTVAGGMAPVMGEANDDPMNYNAAITGSYYESDELARIKSLALLK